MPRFDTDLLEQLPAHYHGIRDYREICGTEQVEFDILAATVNNVADNFFFQSMDARAIAQWEAVFHLTATPADTLEFRRTRLLNRISSRQPYTLAYLGERLDALVGPGKWTVEVDYPNYTLYVETAASNQSYAQEIAATLHRIKPAHVVYINRPYLANALLLAQQVNRQRAEYNYKLGAWALGQLPFATIQDLEVIVMPSQATIRPSLISDVADFVAEDVSSVRLNGSIIIPTSALNRYTQPGAAFVEYTVTQAQAAVVEKIELLNAAGGVLTSAPVYVPIADNARFKHKISIKEGV